MKFLRGSNTNGMNKFVKPAKKAIARRSSRAGQVKMAGQMGQAGAFAKKMMETAPAPKRAAVKAAPKKVQRRMRHRMHRNPKG